VVRGEAKARPKSWNPVLPRTGIQKMNQKPEGDAEDKILPGKDNRITNLLLFYVHRNQANVIITVCGNITC
jgi:hypothetical protein